MKKNLVTMAAMAAVVMIAPLAVAQTAGHMEAKIPFAFDIARAHLSPGTYTVSIDNTMAGVKMVRFNNSAAGQHAMFVATFMDSAANARPSMKFRCAGESCRLESVESFNANYHAPASKKAIAAERERTYTIFLTPTGKSAD
jgi:hypothetical protein